MSSPPNHITMAPLRLAPLEHPVSLPPLHCVQPPISPPWHSMSPRNVLPALSRSGVPMVAPLPATMALSPLSSSCSPPPPTLAVPPTGAPPPLFSSIPSRTTPSTTRRGGGAISKSRRRTRARATELFRCPYPNCNKTSSEHSNLKAHMRLHTGETPYVCQRPGCGKRFRWKSSLTYHEKALHSNLRPFACYACNKRFVEKRKLQLHLDFCPTRHQMALATQPLVPPVAERY